MGRLVLASCVVLSVALVVGWLRMRRRVLRKIRRSASDVVATFHSGDGRPAPGTRKTPKPS